MNIKWSDQLHNVRNDPKYTPRELPHNLLDHCLPIISAVKLIKNQEGLYDTGLSLQPLVDNPEGVFTHPNGMMTNVEYLNMITFLGEINRSKLVPKMYKTPRLGSLTPLGLYAYKLNFDIPYNAWAKDAKYLSLYLGKFLAPILKVTTIPELSNKELMDFRDLMQTVKTTGERKLNTAYRSAIKTIKLPAPAVYMILQLWLANNELRDVDSMILDPVDWDKVPEALDATTVAAPVVTKVANVVDPDAWWKD